MKKLLCYLFGHRFLIDLSDPPCSTSMNEFNCRRCGVNYFVLTHQIKSTTGENSIVQNVYPKPENIDTQNQQDKPECTLNSGE